MMMRQTRTSTRQTAPQVGPESSAWWESRLVSYRQFVLFLWSSLTFYPSFLPGVAVWALLHALIMTVFLFSGSVLEVCGNLLVITSILYALLQIGLRYGNMALFPAWNEDYEQRFREICFLLAALTIVLSTGGKSVMDSRHVNPKMFYGCGFLLSFVLYHVGQWLSVAYIIHGLVCVLLLLPLVMERYKPEPEQFDIKLHRIWVEFTGLLRQLQLRIQASFRRNRIN